jgi:hypothetical protein
MIHNNAKAMLNERYHVIAFQSMKSFNEAGRNVFQVEGSRGGQPFSLQRKIKVKTRMGHRREMSRAPGGPRNSNSLVLGFNSICFLSVDMTGETVSRKSHNGNLKENKLSESGYVADTRKSNVVFRR